MRKRSKDKSVGQLKLLLDESVSLLQPNPTTAFRFYKCNDILNDNRKGYDQAAMDKKKTNEEMKLEK